MASGSQYVEGSLPPFWINLKMEAANVSETLVPYSILDRPVRYFKANSKNLFVLRLESKASKLWGGGEDAAIVLFKEGTVGTCWHRV
jgi:hypothetical protein